MAGLSRRRLHRAPRNLSIPGGGLQPFRLTLTTSTPTIAEGADAVWSIALDRRGYTPQIGDPPIVFYMRIPSDTTAQGSDWTITQAALFATANAVTGVTQAVVGGAYQFSLAYNFVGPIPLIRPSKDDTVTEAEKFTALIIENAIVGSPHNVVIVEPSRVDVILTDEGGPAPPPTISLVGSSVMEGAANGTAIGLFSSSAGGTPQFTLTHVDGVAIDGTDRLKITGLNGLQAGTVATDYETLTNHTATVTSSDGGGPTIFNITVINNTSDDPVIEYVSTPAHDGYYVTVGAPAGFVIARPTVPGGTGFTIVDVGTYRYPSYLNVFGAGSHYNDLRNIFDVIGGNLVVAAAHAETKVVNQPQQSSGTLNFFEGTYGGPQTPLVMTGCGWYKVTLRHALSAGGTQDVVYRIRAAYSPITPVNSSGFTLEELASLGAFVPSIQSMIPNRHIKVPAAVAGVASWSATVNLHGSYLLVEGHDRFVAVKNSKINIQGNRIHLKDLQILPGIGTPGTDFSARDPIEITRGSEIYFENITAGWGTDDIGIGTNAPRGIKRIHWYRCLFAEPSWANVHSDPGELQHPYGPRHGHWLTQIEMLKCIIIGHKARSPQIDANYGYLLQNNILAMDALFGPGVTGFTTSTVSRPLGSTVISRDNLYLDYNRPYQQNTWSAVEEVYAVNKVITAPSPGGATADIPVLNTDGLPGQGADSYPAVHTVLQNAAGVASTAVFRTYLPFLPPSTAHYTSMPIVTEANRNALIADVLDYAGTRKRDGSGNLLSGDANAAEITRRILSNFRAKTSSGIYYMGMARFADPISTCAAGAPGDACRAVGGYVTGA